MAPVARANISHVWNAVSRRWAGHDVPMSRTYFVEVPKRIAAQYDAIYAYGQFPRDSHGIPVLWHDGPTDVALLRRNRVPEPMIADNLDVKRACLSRATRIAVSSEFAREELVRQFGADPAKIDVLPFILPYLTPLDPASIAAKHQGDVPTVLFVGREARRKGLDVLIEAFVAMIDNGNVAARLVIVSSFIDGPIEIPKRPDIEVIGEVPVGEVQQLMRQAHVFAMPSRVEMYGIVYVEAMAQGAVPIAPDREPQRSILGGGAYGLLVDGRIETLRDALARLCSDPIGRLAMAQAGRGEFDRIFAIDHVLEKFADMIRRTIGSAPPYHRN